MEGSYERQIEDKIMGKVDERVNDKVNELYGKIDGLKARFTGYLIITGLVASLIGGSVGYVLNNRTEKEIKDLDTKVSSIYLQSVDTTPDNLIFPDDMTTDITSGGLASIKPSKSMSDSVMNSFSEKRLIHPMPVPGSSKQVESSFEEY